MEVEKRKPVKDKIVYARAYRYLKFNSKAVVIYLVLGILPWIFGLLMFYDELTFLKSKWAIKVLEKALPQVELTIEKSYFLPFLKEINFVSLHSVLPSRTHVIWNIIAVIGIASIFFVLRRKVPLAIYFINMMASIHLISCLIFLWQPEAFPYTATVYSELYIKQIISLWLSFIIIYGIATSLLNDSGITKYINFLCMIAYLFVFGALRYILCLFLLSKGGLLYMAICFFAIGPFFDFLYLIYFYSILVKHVGKKLQRRMEEQLWKW